MKLTYEFVIVAAFFIAYKLGDIYQATALLMLLFSLKVIFSYLRFKKVDPVDMATFVLVMLAGSLTLYFRNELFIKYKPSVLHLLFALVLLLGYYVYKKNFLQLLLGKQLQLPELAWKKLLHFWSGFFIFMAAINAYMAAYFSNDSWMNFKIWGFVFPLLAVVVTGFIVAPYIKDLPSNKSDRNS